MPDETRYVALKRLTFGGEVLEPGDEVPIEEGRNYRQMLRLGQIREAGASGAPPPRAGLLHRVPEGHPAVFLASDHTLHRVQFLGLQEPPEEALEGLGIEPGSPEARQAALVSFGDEAFEIVRAIGTLRAKLDERAEFSRELEEIRAAYRAKRNFIKLLVKLS